MPALNSGLVLVTGGTGYVGAWVIKYLVDNGYDVVAAVRTAAQGDFLTNRFPAYSGRVSHAVVPDISKEGAYDDAVKDVDAIIHVASPLLYSWEDPQEVIGPAVAGTSGILKSATTYGAKVQRVIITSSASAVCGFMTDKEYDENDWNLADLNTEHTKTSSPLAVYNTAKTRAEKAAFDYVRATQPRYDLVTLLPAFNFGPYIHQPGKHFGSSPGALLAAFPVGGETSGALVAGFVDVRDSALLHVLALKNAELSGERLINANGVFAWQDLYDILNEAGYDAPGKDTKGAGEKKHMKLLLRNNKTFKYFPDFKYRGLKESVLDMAVDLKSGGYLT
ncbi:NAD(P)-binding protein [Auriscalpium vulgare]|uniref:NAD(P)-binding protein n=1 Tax=Auriscalpium vulgare TaxID=40419 RepID=A0ACB8R9W5_9AGAM|nr:NAD(P)-binding protein [Auriscalpium vulgare]